ncbi:hypothetical protein D3C75_1017320 [compost metagenome]
MRMVSGKNPAEGFLLRFNHQCRQFFGIYKPLLPLLIKTGFKQKAGVDIHEEGYTVLDFCFEQGNFLLGACRSLHLGIGHNDLCEG